MVIISSCNTYRAKDQLQINWETTLGRLRTQLTQYLMASAEDTTVKEVNLTHMMDSCVGCISESTCPAVHISCSITSP